MKRIRIDARALFISLIFAFVTALCFYNSLYAMAITIIPGIYIYRTSERMLEQRIKRQLRMQFHSFLGAMDTAIKAGYSIPNGIVAATGYLTDMYGVRGRLVCGLIKIENMVKLGIDAGDGMKKLGIELSIEEIIDFGMILELLLTSGGDVARIIESSAETISRRIALEDELQVVTASKRLECYVMLIMPYLIIIYLRTVNKGYMEPLYSGMTGRIVMTVALITIMVAFYISNQIMEKINR